MSDSNAVPLQTAARPMHPLASFAVKTVIVMAATTVSLVILTDNLINGVNDMLEGQLARLRYALVESDTLGKTGTLTRAEQFLDRAVRLSDTIPAERARPFILEAGSAFSPAPAAASPQDK